MTDELIASDRLELPLLTLEQLDAIADGDASPVASALDAAITPAWVDEVRWLAAFRAKQLRERPQDRPWLLRPIIRTESGQPREVIGYLNFHAPRTNTAWRRSATRCCRAARGQGYALEAVRAAFGWATRAHGVRRFRASVAPDNERSLNLIGKLGFVRTGEQWDERDGLEWVYQLEV